MEAKRGFDWFWGAQDGQLRQQEMLGSERRTSVKQWRRWRMELRFEVSEGAAGCLRDHESSRRWNGNAMDARGDDDDDEDDDGRERGE
jgi:hypothetical protein